MENDLISRKALLDTLQNHFGQDLAYLGEDLQYCQEAVQFAPAVEAEPVRHGRWGEQNIIGYDGIHPVWGKPCSGCGYETELYYPNYCPNCGCKMDGGAEG